MAFDFPSSPAIDDEFIDTATGVTYVWNSYAWTRKGSGSTTAPPPSGDVWVEEAPEDSVPYARRNKAWVPADLMTADRPIFNTITPATAAVTVTTPVTVTLSGSKFSVTCKIYFGNKLMPSAFQSPSSMTFPLIPSEQTVGPHIVTISNGGLVSQPRTFTIT